MGHGFKDQRQTGGALPGIYMNPGTEPVEGTSVEHAQTNMRQLAADVPGATDFSGGQSEENGRYAFTMIVNGKPREIDMPGLPLERVRYTGADDQDIWDFPRLYVDGSSWVWLYATRILSEQEEE